MPIINEMVQSCKLNPNEKRRWKKRGTLPCEILYILHQSGIVLETESPKTGMGLMRFLDLLWKFVLFCPDNKTTAEALNLYEDTVRHELMPNCKHKVKQKKPRIVWPEKTDRKTRECFDPKNVKP